MTTVYPKTKRECPSRRNTPGKFWANVQKGDGCWEWQGCTEKDGYGVFFMWGRQWRAHRLAYILTHGHVLPNVSVLHECDNRRCVRPDHLFLGTNTDNMADRYNKGRSASGEHHGRAILTESIVLTCRDRFYAGNETARALAREYGVGESTMLDAIHGKSWRHINRGRDNAG